MNITAIVAIIFYLAIIIIPLVLVIRETLKDIARMEMPPEEKKKRKRDV